ncbi:flagellar basal-body rod protein FlgC [Loktanella fryxellensis]|uniref:Flagellar basal body rod protein FlgB n=1 Tax=Loktanella fryxellensis TaxID=245187 RepID=A0A1H7ZQL8_9RHOB|nr:flagellar basal body rod protein FlgC [Loktanella fryxellensis]SEM60705.1 flagellar basal-body rod protein FlgC [Loktanella fryxellensis]
MTDFSDALSISTSGMRAQATRLRHVSENIANADTPGYRRKTVSFGETMQSTARSGGTIGTIRVGPMRLDPSPLTSIHDPANPLADAAGNYDGSNVDLLMEIADAREAQRSYEANLKMFDQIRQMGQGLLDLLRN